MWVPPPPAEANVDRDDNRDGAHAQKPTGVSRSTSGVKRRPPSMGTRWYRLPLGSEIREHRLSNFQSVPGASLRSSSVPTVDGGTADLGNSTACRVWPLQHITSIPGHDGFETFGFQTKVGG